MLNCKDTARLLSEGLDRKLTLWQRLNLRIHLMMCDACSAYRRQITLLNRLVRQRFVSDAIPDQDGSESSCPDQVKHRICENLRKHAQ